MIWELPVIALRNTVIMPGTTVNIDVGRAKSKRAIDEAQASDKRVILLTQRDQRTDDPLGEDLHKMGTLAVIKQVVRLPDSTLQVLIEGLERAEVTEYLPSPYLRVNAETKPRDLGDERVTQVLLPEARNAFEEYVKQNKNLRLESFQLENLRSLTDAGLYADLLTHHSTWSVDEKQAILDAVPVSNRVELVLKNLNRDLERFNLDRQIAQRVKEQMDQNQREYYLREQMKAISKELGNGEEGPAEMDALRDRIMKAGMPEKVQEKALKELARLERTPGGSPEGTVIRNYIDWLLDVPWTKSDEEILDIKRTREFLDEDHYGLQDVKERILEFLAVRQLRAGKEDKNDRELRAPILCLVGPPGVGKTSLGKSIARSLNRNFVRMALGGVRDEAEIRGHRRTYIGSMPGRIIQAMKQAGVVNPVILLDEIDKMSADWRGDPASAMLEVLDPEQNNTFQDHYMEVQYDLSNVMFITTANSLSTIPRPLLDRMEVIQIPGYTLEEKVQIAKQYRLPRQLRAHGVESKVEVTDGALTRISQEYTAEAGVRNLDREISKLARKAARELLETPWDDTKVIDAPQVPDYLGVPRYRRDEMEREPQVGAAQGMAWTAVGGALLVVEALATPGTGKVSLTGSLGDVMKESAQAAVAYLRAHATKYGADPEFYKKLDIHLHFPDGATPKDGPSAGITIATAVASAITGRPVRMDVSMTGEISLRGKVLRIGGVKEKLLAAHQAGIRTVIVPKDNEPNLVDIPESIRKELRIIPVATVSEVLDLLLLDRPKDAPPVIPPQPSPDQPSAGA
ncbi:endopeptidase La [Deinococcus misasensis]|uniref:endopeptidase La n=1 Tax=Deinococcus misasensis TaxID=392413 RepID=UPI000558D428|nr:endopeptidase La [Deinococcus misasensis]